MPGEQYQTAATVQLGCRLILRNVRFQTEVYRARLAVENRDFLFDYVTGNFVIVPGG